MQLLASWSTSLQDLPRAYFHDKGEMNGGLNDDRGGKKREEERKEGRGLKTHLNFLLLAAKNQYLLPLICYEFLTVMTCKNIIYKIAVDFKSNDF